MELVGLQRHQKSLRLCAAHKIELSGSFLAGVIFMASIGLEVLGACLIGVTIYLLWAAGPSKNGSIRRFAMTKGIAPMYPILLMALFIAGASLMAAGFGVPIGLLSAKPA